METADRDRDRRTDRDGDGEEAGRALSPLSVFLLGLVVLVGFGCGKKGDPRAPELAMPEVIEDLKAQEEKGGIVLTWSRPQHYVDGQELRDLAAFVIFRKEVPQACPECPAPYREQITVSVEDQEKFIKKRRFRFQDRRLTPRMIYRYRVFSRLTDGSQSGPSNDAEIVWRP